VASDGPIVFAFDGSDEAKAAIARAGQLLSGRKAIVLTVWEPPTIWAAGEAETQIEGDMARAATRIADEGADLAREAGFEASAQAERGVPAWQAITEAADDAQASVIVLGSRGRSGVKYVLLGSVATAVAQHTTRTVLIVH
jgi:nucleotide-binding universal stress UspA family protein